LVEIHPLPGLPGKWVKYNKKNYLFIYTFFDQPRGQTRGWIFTRDSSKDVKSRKDVPFAVIKVKFNFISLFITKTVKFWPKTGQFFDRKCL